MANTKMFVHYSKTKAEFIAAGLPTQYHNSIVFIKGDANGVGSCIYTHGTYFANFAEFIDAYVKALNYVKGVNVNGTNYNAAAGGGYVAFSASDPTTVAVNAGQNGITIGLTDAFIGKVRSTATALGSASDEAAADGSAFARIAKLAEDLTALTGAGSGSVSDQIAALKLAIEGDLSKDATDAKTLEAINDELNAIDAKWASYVSKAELSAIGDNKADGDKVNVKVTTLGGKVTAVEVNETGLTNALNLKANAADVYTKTNVYTKTEAEQMAQGKVDTLANTAVKANAEAIRTLNGGTDTDGSVDKKIHDAINAFAGSANGDKVIENVTELLEYVSGVDGNTTLAAAIADIELNKAAISTLKGDANTAGSVAKAVADEASLREEADNDINDRIDALASVVGAPESDVEATGIFKVIEDNEKTTASALTDLDTRLLDVESKKAAIDSALQAPDITTGGANGTISVKGSDVKVKGLGSAAYTEISAYASAAQGAKADTAYQKPVAGIPLTDLAARVYTQAEVDDMWAWAEL